MPEYIGAVSLTRRLASTYGAGNLGDFLCLVSLKGGNLLVNFNWKLFSWN